MNEDNVINLNSKHEIVHCETCEVVLIRGKDRIHHFRFGRQYIENPIDYDVCTLCFIELNEHLSNLLKRQLEADERSKRKLGSIVEFAQKKIE